MGSGIEHANATCPSGPECINSPCCSDTIDTLRRDVERLTRERDAAYAASLRSDEVHAEAMRAVRGRAEKAEAERDEARARLRRVAEAAKVFGACDGSCRTCMQAGEPCASRILHAALADAKEDEHG